MKSNSLLKKAHLFRCARITRSNVLPEYACARRIHRAPRIWNLFDQAPGKTFSAICRRDDLGWMRCLC